MLIESNINTFLHCLENIVPISFKEEKWSNLSSFFSYFSYNHATVEDIGQHLIRAMDRLELYETEQDADQLKNWIKCAKLCARDLNKDFDVETCQELRLRIDALRIRIGVSTKKRSPDDDFRLLDLKFRIWASNRWHLEDKSITRTEREIFDKLKRHPHLLRRLTKCHALFVQFLKYSITYKCGGDYTVDIFERFPGLTKKLIDTRLYKMIGYHGGLRVTSSTDRKVLLRAKLEDENGQLVDSNINLLDPQTVHRFKSNYLANTRKIFDVFERYNHKVVVRDTTLTYGEKGIENYNSFQHGYWDDSAKEWIKVDLSRRDYYEDLPHLGKTVSKGELEQQFNITIQEGDWVSVLEAGRNSPDLDPNNAHAWIMIYRPSSQPNTYEQLLAVGFRARHKYITAFQKMKLLMNTVPGAFYINENHIYNVEQQFRREAFTVSADRKDQMMESIRKKLILADKGVLPCQVLGENCFKTLVDLMKEFIDPGLFTAKCPEDQLKLHMLNFDVKHPVVGFVKRRGQLIKEIFIGAVAMLYGQHRSMECESPVGKKYKVSLASSSPFAEERSVYSPQYFVAVSHRN